MAIDNQLITIYVHGEHHITPFSLPNCKAHDMTNNNEHPALDPTAEEILRKFTGSSVSKVYDDPATRKPAPMPEHVAEQFRPIKAAPGG